MTMNLHRLLAQRATAKRPLRLALIGAGKFGSMFLAQASRTPGIHLVAVVDLAPQRARERLRTSAGTRNGSLRQPSRTQPNTGPPASWTTRSPPSPAARLRL